jgi:hypothetical protein
LRRVKKLTSRSSLVSTRKEFKCFAWPWVDDNVHWENLRERAMEENWFHSSVENCLCFDLDNIILAFSQRLVIFWISLTNTRY